jgi:hypothetical protein
MWHPHMIVKNQSRSRVELLKDGGSAREISVYDWLAISPITGAR